MQVVKLTKPTYPAILCPTCGHARTIRLRQGAGWCYGCKKEFLSQAYFPDPTIADLNEALMLNKARLRWYTFFNDPKEREREIWKDEQRVSELQARIRRLQEIPYLYDSICEECGQVEEALENRKQDLINIAAEVGRIKTGDKLSVSREPRPRFTDAQITAWAAKSKLNEAEVREILR